MKEQPFLADNPISRSLLVRVWIVCALGLFIDGFDLYITSVAEPFFQRDLHIAPAWLGVVQAAAPIGAALGAVLIGRVTDHLGRKAMLVQNFMLFVVAALLSAFSWNIYALCAFRFLVGFGIGADYPICAAYLAEMSPRQSRGKLMASAMFINCLASPIGVGIAYLIFSIHHELDVWRYMFAFGALPALVTLIIRYRLPESFIWKINRRLRSGKQEKLKTEYRKLFSHNYLKATIALCLCWFLMDISYYGVGLFTPAILGALHLGDGGSLMSNASTIIESTLFVNAFVAFGAFLSIFAIDRMPRVSLQKSGFLLSFIGLLGLAVSSHFHAQLVVPLVFAGFIIFNIFVNFGPGITTYLLPAEIYPTEIRATGHGVASGVAKLGAFAGTLFLPVLMKNLGVNMTVFILALTLLVGYALTNLLKSYDMSSLHELADYKRESPALAAVHTENPETA